MDPRKVYTRPTNLTPMQVRAFDIVDGFIRQGTPAMLDYIPLALKKYGYVMNEDGTPKLDAAGEQIPRNDITPDETVDYWLLVKRNGSIYRLLGWEKEEEELSWTRIPVSQWDEHRTLTFAQLEKNLMGDVSTTETELPLTADDYAAIGITPDEPVTRTSQEETGE